MQKYINSLLILIISACFAACTDSTSTLGVDMMPIADAVTPYYKTYQITTKSYGVGDSVLSRTALSYLGRFSDPETKTSTKAEFVTQFNILEEKQIFPDSIHNDSIEEAYVNLYIEDFVGDSLTNFKVEVYNLDKDLDTEADYYTNFSPEKYLNPGAKPIASKWYTLSDKTIPDSLKDLDDYLPYIRIYLPREEAQKVYDGWRRDRNLFTNTSSWLKSGLPFSKGLYFKLAYGDGAMAYIDITQMVFEYKYFEEEVDSVTSGITFITATEEVVQATRFENSNIQDLLDDKTCTYLKTPAGVFTSFKFPLDSISESDSINMASISFKRYNDRTSSKFKTNIPKTLLLVPRILYETGFFEKYYLPDSEMSFITTFTESTNSYDFDNIGRLISYFFNLKKSYEGMQLPEGWDDILLIPIEYDLNSSGSIVKIRHDFSNGAARLVGGEQGGKTELKLIYSNFNR